MSQLGPPPHHPDTPLPRDRWPSTELVPVGAAVLGAAIWASWLGWDHTASYDRITRTVQDPYVTLQVMGCALTTGVAVAVLGALRRPVAGAGGVALGFWVPWSVEALASDTDGLAGVGVLLLALGLALGTAAAAAVGLAVGALARAVVAWHRGRTWRRAPG